jgi:hypothetical protein
LALATIKYATKKDALKKIMCQGSRKASRRSLYPNNKYGPKRIALKSLPNLSAIVKWLKPLNLRWCQPKRQPENESKVLSKLPQW